MTKTKRILGYVLGATACITVSYLMAEKAGDWMNTPLLGGWAALVSMAAFIGAVMFIIAVTMEMGCHE